MELAKALGKRLGILCVVLFLVTLFSALLLEAVPGSPEDTLVPFSDDDPRAGPVREQIREDNHLDRHFVVRYGYWLGDFATGDFGDYYSISGTFPVKDRVEDSLPVSLQLMAYSQVFALALAIPLGVYTAYKPGRLFDRMGNTGAFAIFAVPNFVLALLLSYYVGVVAGWLPATGYEHFSEDPGEHIRRMILPTIALGSSQVAVYMRLLRSDMVATLQEDFVQMARSKGISDRRVLWRHAFRPSSITLLTLAGINIATLISGALIIEILFDIPGMGDAIRQAIGDREYVALQSFVAIVSIIYVLANFIVDFLYTVIDPRIRHARAS